MLRSIAMRLELAEASRTVVWTGARFSSPRNFGTLNTILRTSRQALSRGLEWLGLGLKQKVVPLCPFCSPNASTPKYRPLGVKWRLLHVAFSPWQELRAFQSEDIGKHPKTKSRGRSSCVSHTQTKSNDQLCKTSPFMPAMRHH